MHTPQIITQSLSPIAPVKNNNGMNEGKPTTSFNSMLNKEVNNQNKVSAKNNSNDANKNKVNKTNEAPPPVKQEGTDIQSSDSAIKKTNEESDSAVETADDVANDANTLLAFVDQLNQLGLKNQLPTGGDHAAPEGNSEDLSLDVQANNENAVGVDTSNKAVIQGLSTTDIKQADSSEIALEKTELGFKELIQGNELSNQDQSKLSPNLGPAPTSENKGLPVSENKLVSEIKDQAIDLSLAQVQAGANALAQQMVKAESGSTEKLNNLKNSSVGDAVSELGKKEVKTKVNRDGNEIEDSKFARDMQTTTANQVKFASALEVQNARAFETKVGQQSDSPLTDQTIASNSIQNQAPPSETAKLNELIKTQVGMEQILPRVGTKAWDQAIGQKVVWMVAGGEQSAELTLNPPDLGPLQVVLSISDNQVDASFVSSHLDVREAIQAAAPQLKEMLDNAGISLSGFSVNAESKPSDSQFAQERSNGRQTTSSTRSESDVKVGELPVNHRLPRTQLGAVDTFV